MHPFVRISWLLISILCLVQTSKGATQVVSLPTAQAALVGRFSKGPVNLPYAVYSATDFEQTFGSTNLSNFPAEIQAREFFANGGDVLYIVRVSDTGPLLDALVGRTIDQSGLNALSPLSDLRTLIVPEASLVPSDSFATAFAAIRAWCEPRRIFFILDPPPGLTTVGAMTNWINAAVPAPASFCAVYYPYLQVSLDGVSMTTTASGAMAATFAKNDDNSAVWKSPSGVNYPLAASGLTPTLTTNDQTNLLNASVNPLRQFNDTGVVPYGARTLDRSNDDLRYIPSVRTVNWVAASVQRSLAFAATRDNAAPLWSDVQTLVSNFLQSLYQQGAFQGSVASQAYFVRCDSTTTTSTDIAAHHVNLIYGMALLQVSQFVYTPLTAATADATRVPTVPVLRPLSFDEGFYLFYPTEAGFTYHYQGATRLINPDWSDRSVQVGDGAWHTEYVSIPKHPISGYPCFFRVQIAPSPYRPSDI